MKAPAALTRKLGPLPVYAWGLLAVAAWFLLVHSRIGSGATSRPVSATPAASGSPVAADTSGGGGAGGGSGVDPLISGLFQSQQGSIDALVGALIRTPAASAVPLEAGGAPGASASAGPASSPAPLAPAGTTVVFQGTTYDVSGQPEFSPGNYNPNSPAGVLAMNQWLSTQTGVTTTPTPAPTPVAPSDPVYGNAGQVGGSKTTVIPV